MFHCFHCNSSSVLHRQFLISYIFSSPLSNWEHVTFRGRRMVSEKIMLFYVFIYFFCILFLVFHHKVCVFIIFFFVFDEVSNFCNRTLINQKQELVIWNCQWNCIQISFSLKKERFWLSNIYTKDLNYVLIDKTN